MKKEQESDAELRKGEIKRDVGGAFARAKAQAAAVRVKAVHEVKSGDTLSHLALHYYGHATRPYYMLIYEANKEQIGDDPNRVKTGLKLNIPDLPPDMEK